MINNKVFNNIGIYTLIAILTGFFQFVFISYFARILSLENTGIIGLILAFTYLTVPLIIFGTLDLVGLNVINYNKSEFINFFNNLVSFFLISVLLTIIVTVIITLTFEKDLLFFLVVIIFSFFRSLIAIHDKILIINKKKKKYAIEKIRTGLLTLFFGYLFINMHQGWISYFAAIILAEFISLIFRYYKYYKYYKFRFDYKKHYEFFYYGLPFVINLGGAWILNQSDKIIIEKFYGLEMLAGYALAFQIGIIIRTFSNSISNSMLPVVYKSYSQDIIKTIQIKFFFIFSAIGFIVISLLLIFLKYFFNLIYGNKFDDFKIVIVIISLAFIFEGIYRVFDSYIIFKKKNYLKTYILYLSALIGLLSSILLNNLLGFIGPALGVLIAYFSLMILSTYHSNNLSKKYENIS